MRSHTRKLSLAKQTLRSLSAGELGGVHGGEFDPASLDNGKTVIAKPTSTSNDPNNPFCQILILDLPKFNGGGGR